MKGFNHDMHTRIRGTMGNYFDLLKRVNIPILFGESGMSFPNVSDKLVQPKYTNGRNPV